MDRRSNNIAIFQDSMDLIKANQKLQQAVQFSIQNQKLYVPSQAIALPEPRRRCNTGKYGAGRMPLPMQHTVSMSGYRNDVASVLSTAPENRQSTL